MSRKIRILVIFLTVMNVFLGLSLCITKNQVDKFLNTDSKPIEMDSKLLLISPAEYGIEIDINSNCLVPGFKCKKGYKGEFLFLQEEAAKKLKFASKVAHSLGYKILVFEGWRPTEMQELYFGTFKGTPYAAYADSPKALSAHTRGISVDAVLIDKSTGKVLDFGSDFDVKSNHISYTEEFTIPLINQEQLKNRTTLNGVMSIAGFSSVSGRWWNFVLRDSVLGSITYPKYKAGVKAAELINLQ